VEIIDYLGALGRRCWILILTPIVAGLLFAGLAFHLLHQNVVNAQINSPTLTGVRGAKSDGNQYSIELQNTLQVELAKPAVLKEISKESGVSVAKLKAGLSVGRKKPSSYVVISFKGGSVKKSKLVATAAANVAYGSVLSYEQQVSTAPLTSAQQDLASAQGAVISQVSSTPDPLTSYVVDRIEVARLEAALARHLSTGNLAAALSDQAALAKARTQENSLVAAVGLQGELINSRNQARTAQASRYRGFVKASDRLAASSPDKVIHVGSPQKPIPLKDMVLIGGSAGGAALVLMMLIQWISEARRWLRIKARAPAPAR